MDRRPAGNETGFAGALPIGGGLAAALALASCCALPMLLAGLFTGVILLYLGYAYV